MAFAVCQPINNLTKYIIIISILYILFSTDIVHSDVVKRFLIPFFFLSLLSDEQVKQCEDHCAVN